VREDRVAGEISTIQSLKAVDAWIDVINANINGGVRTAFKASRLKFAGSNTNVVSSGHSTSLPLQFPEPSLTTANTVIDFTQGAITASTENTHLAIQGPDDAFFRLVNPKFLTSTGAVSIPGGTDPNEIPILFTRDGEFHTDKQGLLVSSFGWYLLSSVGAVYNDLDLPPAPGLTAAARLSDVINFKLGASVAADGVTPNTNPGLSAVIRVNEKDRVLHYSFAGSTVFDRGQRVGGPAWPQSVPINLPIAPGSITILTKSLESSNTSMTQSVPELSLAQKLFSALTKVLQTKQTNVDGVLNLVR
jgi:flagellar hook protein FlgE